MWTILERVERQIVFATAHANDLLDREALTLDGLNEVLVVLDAGADRADVVVIGQQLGFGAVDAEDAGGLAYVVLIRPSWVVPMLAGVVVLTISGWMQKTPDGA